MNADLRRAIGILASLACLLAGLVAALNSLLPLVKGAFLGLFLPPVLLAVAICAVLSLLPLVGGMAGLVINLSSKNPPRRAIAIPVVGFVSALFVGSVGARLSGDPNSARTESARRTPGCLAATADPVAINRPCTTPTPWGQGSCPDGYHCVHSVRYADRYVCEVTCLRDCECMAGATCRNSSCQFGTNLP